MRRLQTLVGYVGTENSRHSGHTHAARRRERSPYSITSSALASNVAGTVRPSTLAVLRLMISSNFVGGMILPVCPGAAINVIGVKAYGFASGEINIL